MEKILLKIFLVFQSPASEVGAATDWALSNGYRLIDTATLYQNEKEIGDVLQKYLKDGKIKREEVFITTKVTTNAILYGMKVQIEKNLIAFMV